jgi:peptide deformylase
MKKLILYPDPILLKNAEPYKFKEKISNTLKNDMFKIMRENGGVGLAGPQIGILKRIIVFINPDNNSNLCLINPAYTLIDNEIDYLEEQCLSLPGVTTSIKRYSNIFVTSYTTDWLKLRFEARGVLSRIIQHEIDHLNGITLHERIMMNDNGEKLNVF